MDYKTIRDELKRTNRNNNAAATYLGFISTTISSVNIDGYFF